MPWAYPGTNWGHLTFPCPSTVPDCRRYPQCGDGTNQSPINIVESTAVQVSYDTLQLTNYGRRAAGDTLVNTGRTGN